MAVEEQHDSTVPNLLFSGSEQSSFACNACKKKKIKCNRIAPQCSHCQKAGRSCEYPLSVPKPGPKAGFARRKRQLSSVEAEGEGDNAANASDEESSSSGVDNYLNDIVHPRHQHAGASTWEEENLIANRQLSPATGDGAALARALKNLGLSWQDCRGWITSYFDNMTAFSLFHRPSFDYKLTAINSAREVEALLLVIIAVAKHFGNIGRPSAVRELPASGLWERARYMVRECLDEYVDDVPPLHLLQTLLLTTWNQLYHGVRSRSWRTLGECIRICYEMRLHEEDDSKQPLRSWIEREERRRAWWCAYELDVFASTIKRLPTAINWTTNKTKLAVADSVWYSGIGAESCIFSLEPTERWKLLEKTGNTSGQSWFIVINSYKYEACLLSTNPQSCALDYAGEISTADAVRRYRDMLINCVHCAQLALPETLSMRDRFLSFRQSERAQDAWRYCIHLIVQVTKFMLYRLDILFKPKTNRHGNKAQRTENGPSKLVWEQFIASGDETVKVLRNCAQDHVKWINPCVANAIWFGAAALVVGQVLGPSSVDRQMLMADFDLLRSTVRQYVHVNNVPDSLVSGLDNLEGNLRALTEKGIVDLGRLSSVSLSETRSPTTSSISDPSKLTPRSEPFSEDYTHGVGNHHMMATLETKNAAPYIDTSGLDMTQEFPDVDDLWASTTDWNFNLDCFRIPYD